MPASDPVDKLQEVLLARGMVRADVPAFIDRYAKLPVLTAAELLQQRGIHYEIAYLALLKLQEPEITRESELGDALNASAGFWTLLSVVSFCAGLWILKHGALAATLGPWAWVVLFGFGLLSAIVAISKWIG